MSFLPYSRSGFRLWNALSPFGGTARPSAGATFKQAGEDAGRSALLAYRAQAGHLALPQWPLAGDLGGDLRLDPGADEAADRLRRSSELNQR